MINLKVFIKESNMIEGIDTYDEVIQRTCFKLNRKSAKTALFFKPSPLARA